MRPSLKLALLAAAVFVAWFLISWSRAVPVYVLPSPGSVVSELARIPRYYAHGVAHSGAMVGIGLGIALAIGTALAAIVSRFPPVGSIIMPILIVSKAVPAIAFVPILLMILGMGWRSELALTVMLAVVPVTLSVASGLRDVPTSLVHVVVGAGSTRRNVLFRILLPHASLHLLLGMRLALPLAFIGSVVAEMTAASDSGLGNIIAVSYATLNMPAMYAGLLCLCWLALGFYGLVELLARRILPPTMRRML